MAKEKIISELRVVRLLLEEKDWEVLDGIQDSDFTGYAADAIQYTRDFFNKNDQFPAIDMLVEDVAFPDTDLFPKAEVLNRFALYKKTKRVFEFSKKITKAISNREPDLALAEMQLCLEEVKPKKDISSFKEQAAERFERYQKNKIKPMKGVLPPFHTWEKNIRFFENGSFNALIGISHSGKSWISGYCALHAATAQGKKVLLVSMENTTSSMEDRIDSMFFNIPFSHLKSLILDFRTEDDWEEAIPTAKEIRGDVLTAGGDKIKTVKDIYQLCCTENPDFVIIDGAYKLSSVNWEDSSKLLQDFHDFAQSTNIPWLCSTQLAPDANELSGRAAGMKARGNKSWFQDPATVTVITQSDDDKVKNQIKVEVVKDREGGDKSGISSEFNLTFDMISMIIEEVEEYVDTEVLENV